MKTLECDLCDATAQGETFEEWMQALRPHSAANCLQSQRPPSTIRRLR